MIQEKCTKNCVINCIMKIFNKAFKKITRLTLYQLVYCTFTIISIIFIVNWIYINRAHNNHFKRLFEAEYPKPVIQWWTKGVRIEHDIIHCTQGAICEVFDEPTNNVRAYLFYASKINFDDLPLPRRPSDIIWGLFHEESPRNVNELLHEKALNLFNFSATFSRHSNVPFPLQELQSLDSVTSTSFFVETAKKNSLLDQLSPILYLQSDCETSNERDAYVKELMNFVKIDSYGNCLNNKHLPENFKTDYLNRLNNDDFLKFVAQYKFTIAIENGVCDDYVTEKLWRPIKVGSVPIYFGSPSVRDWLPNNNSAILLEDFPTPKLLSEHLVKLLTDDKLYEEHLEHKTKGIIRNIRIKSEIKERPYQTDFLNTLRKFECFVCEKLHKSKPWKMSIVNKSHYDCPTPVSALALGVNPNNPWVSTWRLTQRQVETLYNKVMNQDSLLR